MQYHEVCIVGAGPGGTAAAIELARTGHDVLLIDRSKFPRDKCCGDGLTLSALRHLEELGYTVEGKPEWQVVNDISLTSPSGGRVSARFPQGKGIYAAIVPRYQFDQSLVDLARDAGALLQDGHALQSAEQDPEGVTLTVAGLGEIRASYVVGADGAFSPLARALAVRSSDRPGLGEMHAFRQYFENVSPTAASELAVWFEADLRPGYAWSFPISAERVNFGFGVHRVRGTSVQYMNRIWADLKSRPHIKEFLGKGAVQVGRVRAWPIPASLTWSGLGHCRTLFVGDAAGVADPLTGEGIGQALLTGRLAASAIHTASASSSGPASLMEDFRISVYSALSLDHRVSKLLIHFLRYRNATSAAIRLLATNEKLAQFFARCMFEEIPRAGILRPWSLRRELSRGGAFPSGK